jgi:hypothetical protein
VRFYQVLDLERIHLPKTLQKQTTQKPKYPEMDRYPELAEFPREDGPEQVASFIADTVTDLAWLAGRHKLDVLCYLLSMVQLEAEELVRKRSKKKLS